MRGRVRGRVPGRRSSPNCAAVRHSRARREFSGLLTPASRPNQSVEAPSPPSTTPATTSPQTSQRKHHHRSRNSTNGSLRRAGSSDAGRWESKVPYRPTVTWASDYRFREPFEDLRFDNHGTQADALRAEFEREMSQHHPCSGRTSMWSPGPCRRTTSSSSPQTAPWRWFISPGADTQKPLPGRARTCCNRRSTSKA